MHQDQRQHNWLCIQCSEREWKRELTAGGGWTLWRNAMVVQKKRGYFQVWQICDGNQNKAKHWLLEKALKSSRGQKNLYEEIQRVYEIWPCRDLGKWWKVFQATEKAAKEKKEKEDNVHLGTAQLCFFEAKAEKQWQVYLLIQQFSPVTPTMCSRYWGYTSGLTDKGHCHYYSVRWQVLSKMLHKIKIQIIVK